MQIDWHSFSFAPLDWTIRYNDRQSDHFACSYSSSRLHSPIAERRRSYLCFMFLVLISQVKRLLLWHVSSKEMWRTPETWKAINRTQIKFEYWKIYSIYTVQTTNRKWIIRWGGTKMIEVKWIYASTLYAFSVCHVLHNTQT